MAIKLPPDGSKKRRKLLTQALKELGAPLVKPVPVRVELFDHVLEPLGPLLAVEGEDRCPPGAVCFNVTVIPSGLHLAEGTHWHPTGETQVLEVMGEYREVTVGRQVPNLIRGSDVVVESKPSRVDAPPVVDHPNVQVEVPSEERVTAAEIAMARAEARAMREGARDRLSNGKPRFGLTREQRKAIMGWD